MQKRGEKEKAKRMVDHYRFRVNTPDQRNADRKVNSEVTIQVMDCMFENVSRFVFQLADIARKIEELLNID